MLDGESSFSVERLATGGVHSGVVEVSLNIQVLSIGCCEGIGSLDASSVSNDFVVRVIPVVVDIPNLEVVEVLHEVTLLNVESSVVNIVGKIGDLGFVSRSPS